MSWETPGYKYWESSIGRAISMKSFAEPNDQCWCAWFHNDHKVVGKVYGDEAYLARCGVYWLRLGQLRNKQTS